MQNLIPVKTTSIIYPVMYEVYQLPDLDYMGKHALPKQNPLKGKLDQPTKNFLMEQVVHSASKMKGKLDQQNRDFLMDHVLNAATQATGYFVKNTNRECTVYIDVRDYEPSEISVTEYDGYLIVDAKHEEKKDKYGYVSRGFARRHPLPEGVGTEHVRLTLSGSGFLRMKIPKAPPKASNTFFIPIAKVGPVRRHKKETKKAQEKQKEKENNEQVESVNG